MPDVDFYIGFSVNVDLPRGSSIELYIGFSTWGFSNGETISDRCWVSLVYSKCKLQGTGVVIAIEEEYTSGSVIQIYLDSALDLPSEAGELTEGVLIKLYWNSVLVASGGAYTPFTVNAASVGLVYPTSIELSTSNAGELATYTFSFTASADVYAEYEIWIEFPQEFDPYLGQAEYELTECSKKKHRIDCSSARFSTMNCYSDHWKIVINSVNTVIAGTEIPISVLNVLNPSVGTVSGFRLFIFSEGVLLMHNTDFGAVSLVSPPNRLIFKSVESCVHFLSSASTYIFSFYIDDTIDASHIVLIQFPQEYQLALQSKPEFPCRTYYRDELTKEDNLSWSSTSSCSVYNNFVSFELATSESKTFNLHQQISIELTNAPTPHWGIPRTAQKLLYDTTDFSLFEEYELWTSRFNLLLYNKHDLRTEYKTYGTLHSGYLGFNYITKETLSIHSYNPRSQSNRIIAYSGTQTADIPINLDARPLSAEKLVLTPSETSLSGIRANLEFTSFSHEFTFFQWTNTVNFRVAVPQSAPPGLYYVDWSLRETLEKGDTTEEYNNPFSTLIEVCAEFALFSFTVSEIPELYSGYTSIPIQITADLAPSSEVTLNLHTELDEITINPSSLAFAKSTAERYFTISVEANFTAQSNPVLKFTVEGQNEDSFRAPEDVVLSLHTELTDDDPPKLSLSLRSRTMNSAVVYASASDYGVLHWWFTCKGAQLPTHEELISLAPDLLTTESPSLKEQLREQYLATEVNLAGMDGDIYEFVWRRYREHCTTRWVSIEVLRAGTQALNFDWLYPDNDYSLVGYLSSPLTPANSTLVSLNFTTSSEPSIYVFSVTIQQDLSVTQEPQVKLVIADSLGINPLWLDNLRFTRTTVENDRRLTAVVDSSTFEWDLLYDVYYSSYTSIDIAGQETYLNQAKQQLVALGVAHSVSEVSFDSYASPDKAVPYWIQHPILIEDSEETLQFSMGLSAAGVACVICSEHEVNGTSAHQVLVGLTTYSAPAEFWNCTKGQKQETIQLGLNGAAPDKDYYCYFSVCSEYPLWPDCNKAEVIYIKIKNTKESDQQNSFSLLTGGLFAAYLVI